ncbi:MAG: DUF4886 domain-containing protein [Verrucomicrobiota bacterium]
MKYVLICLFVFIILCFTALTVLQQEKETVSILFIGNSLTYENNLPKMVKKLAASHGGRVDVESHTIGGARLREHASSTRLQQLFNQQQWDYVVLQEQSQMTGFSEEQIGRDVSPYAKRLVKLAKESSPDTRIIFYMTMARKNGDPENVHAYPDLKTYRGMQRRVNSSYRRLAAENRASIAPVGEIWQAVRRERPQLELYRDSIHPNRTGTYLAACVFYTTIFNQPNKGTYIPYGVDEEAANYICTLIDRTILESTE